MKDLILEKTFEIQAPVSKVWEALTNPAIIKQYFFGTETITDWKKGSPLIFRGVWDGKPYEDKGTILDIENKKLIRYSYWSSFSDKPDSPENYANITYKLENHNGMTTLTVIQDGLDSEERLKHSADNWTMVIDGMKKILT